MSAQPVGDSGHCDEHDGEHQVVPLAGPTKQDGVRGFVDAEATGGHHEEPTGRGRQGCRPVTKGESMMARERHDKGHQPAQHIGHERVPALLGDQTDDHAPMHGRRYAADGDKPADPALLQQAQCPSSACSEDLNWHDAAKHSGQRSICIAIDDFGLHAGINQAALHLAAIGRVQAIGCMVGGPAWATWTDRLRPLDPARIDLGLHLDLTEAPLLPGTVRSLNSLIVASFLRRLDRPSVRAEIRAQLDAFEAAIGRPPAYVDGHQHVHQFPVVRDELLAELTERYRGSRLWLRSTRRARATGASAAAERLAWLKPWIIQRLGATGLASAAVASGYRLTGRLLGVYDFAGGVNRYAGLMVGWLASARHGDVLMCHPSVAVDCDDPLIEARCAEFDVLSGPAFGVQLEQASVALQPMSRILSNAAVVEGNEARAVAGQDGT